MSFMIVGHTHDDIDASFRRWNMELCDKDHPTLPRSSILSLDAVVHEYGRNFLHFAPDQRSASFQSVRDALHWNEQEATNGPFKWKAIQVFCRRQQVAHHVIQTSMYRHPMVAQ